MIAAKLKVENRFVLSAAQGRLFQDTLKRLLGSGLVSDQPRGTEREERLSFLQEALNSKVLDNE